MNEQVSPGNFVRQYVLQHPDASLEDVQQEWIRKGHPKSKMPKQHNIYSVGSVVKKKYGLDSFDDVPRKSSDDLNVNELLRLMFKKHPNLSEKQARYYLRSDGFKFSAAIFAQIMKKSKGVQTQKVAVVSTEEGSPDDNQNAGPRTQHVSKRGRKPGRKKDKTAKNGRVTPAKRGEADKFLRLEEQLDDALFMAWELEDSEMVQFIRNARRRCIHLAVELLGHFPPK
jgi:hypothetical protein